MIPRLCRISILYQDFQFLFPSISRPSGRPCSSIGTVYLAMQACSPTLWISITPWIFESSNTPFSSVATINAHAPHGLLPQIHVRLVPSFSPRASTGLQISGLGNTKSASRSWEGPRPRLVRLKMSRNNQGTGNHKLVTDQILLSKTSTRAWYHGRTGGGMGAAL